MKWLCAILLSLFVVVGVSAQRVRKFIPTPAQLKERAVTLESAKALQRYMNGERVSLPLTKWNRKFNIKNLNGYRRNGFRQVTFLRGQLNCDILLESTKQKRCRLITGKSSLFPNVRWEASVETYLVGGKIEMVGNWDGDEPDQKSLPGYKAKFKPKKVSSVTRETRVTIFYPLGQRQRCPVPATETEGAPVVVIATP